MPSPSLAPALHLVFDRVSLQRGDKVVERGLGPGKFCFPDLCGETARLLQVLLALELRKVASSARRVLRPWIRACQPDKMKERAKFRSLSLSLFLSLSVAL